MYRAQIRRLAGLDPGAPGPATAVAGVRWFHPAAGTVTSVEGDDVLRSDPAVFLHRIKVSAGDVVPVCRDGWQRVGYFAACAPTADELEAVIDRILNTVVINVSPTP